MAKKRFDTNEKWADYLTKTLDLDAYDSNLLLHDLNNLRADEWLDVLLDAELDKVVINSFKAFYNIA